jgi:hypothetical protein
MYRSLVGVTYEHHFNVEKVRDANFRLIDIDTLLAFYRILPMPRKMNMLVKMHENYTAYIA